MHIHISHYDRVIYIQLEPDIDIRINYANRGTYINLSRPLFVHGPRRDWLVFYVIVFDFNDRRLVYPRDLYTYRAEPHRLSSATIDWSNTYITESRAADMPLHEYVNLITPVSYQTFRYTGWLPSGTTVMYFVRNGY